MTCTRTSSYNITFSEKTYTYVFNRQGYSDANQHCIDNYNGTLAMADNEDTLQTIRPNRTLFPQGCADNYFRIGLSNKSGVFSWVDGSIPNTNVENVQTITISGSSCSNYALQPPLNNTKKQEKLKFFIVDCTDFLPFICETAPLKILPPAINPTTIVSTSPKPTTSSTNLGAIIGGAVGVFVLALLALLFVKKCRKSKKSSVKSGEKAYNAVGNETRVNDDLAVESLYAAAAEATVTAVYASDYSTIGEKSAVSASDGDYDHLGQNGLNENDGDYDHVPSNEQHVAYAEINEVNLRGGTSSSSTPAPSATFIDKTVTGKSEKKDLYSTVNKPKQKKKNNPRVDDLYSTVNKPKSTHKKKKADNVEME